MVSTEPAKLSIEVGVDGWVVVRCERCTELLFQGLGDGQVTVEDLRDAVDHLENCEEVEE